MQEDEQQKPPKSSLNSVFWRRAGWAMLGLVLSLLVLAMIAPLFIDWNAYRPRMEAALAAATGRDVVIGGDLSVRTVPALALRAGDVRIGNHEGGVAANLVAMDRFDVVIALFPLLKGDLKSAGSSFLPLLWLWSGARMAGRIGGCRFFCHLKPESLPQPHRQPGRAVIAIASALMICESKTAQCAIMIINRTGLSI